MQLSLRPYVTTGVAIVGASVLVAAPITPAPPDVKIAMPAESVAVAPERRRSRTGIGDHRPVWARSTNCPLPSAKGSVAGMRLPSPFPVAETNGVAGWIGVLPALTLASLQAALDNPRNIPGLASYNIYTLLAAPGALFPPPSPYTLSLSGRLILAVRQRISPHHRRLGRGAARSPLRRIGPLSETLGEVIAKALAVLPDPINPYLPPPSASSVAEFSVMAAPPPPPPSANRGWCEPPDICSCFGNGSPHRAHSDTRLRPIAAPQPRAG